MSTAAASPSTSGIPVSKKYGINASPRTPATGKATDKKDVKATPRSATASSTPSGIRSPTKTASPRTPSNSATPRTPSSSSKLPATKKPDYSNVTSKIGSKDKMAHKPGGGNVKIESRKLKVEAKSRVGSLDNASHKPTGGDKKIETKKLEWKVESKIGSLDNAAHVAGGGDKKIETQKTDWSAKSRIGSLEKANHRPGGGDKKIETVKTEWNVQSKIGSLDNVKHRPGGGDIQIESHHLDFKDKASPKIGSLNSPKRLNSSGSDQSQSDQHSQQPQLLLDLQNADPQSDLLVEYQNGHQERVVENGDN